MKNLWKQKKLMYVVIACVFVFGMMFFSGIETKAATPVPDGLKQVSASGSSVQIQWDAVMGSDMYYYWRISDTDTFANYRSGRNAAVGSSNCTNNINGLSGGKTYFVQVGTSATRANEAPEDTAWSNTVKVVTKPVEVNGKSIQFVDATETSVSLTWGAVEGATAYKVEYGKNLNNASVVYTNTPGITLSNLEKNSKYQVRIYSQRQDGTEFAAVQSSGATKYSIPTLPTEIIGVDCNYFNPSVKDGKAYFKWDENAVTDGFEYEIYKYNGNQPLFSGTSLYHYAQLNNSKLKKRQVYKIRVRGYVNTSNNERKYGAWSSYDYFARCAGSDTKLAKSGEKIKASWKKVTGASGYTVYMSPKKNGNYKKMGTTKKTSYTINKKMKKNHYYYVRIVPNYKIGKTTYPATVNSDTYYSAYGYYTGTGKFLSWN